MDGYKRKVDGIKAPEALIAITLDKLHEEEKKQMSDEPDAEQAKAACNSINKNSLSERRTIQKSGRRTRWITTSVLATAAAAVLFVIVLGGQEKVLLNYNTVPETIVRPISEEQTESTMEAEAYSDYLGIDIQNPIDNAQFIKAKIHVVYDGETVKEDEAEAYYNVDGDQLMIRFSGTIGVMPENLAAGKESEVNGQVIVAGLSENGKERMAAFEKDGISFFIMSNSMDQQEFERVLLCFLEK